MASFFQNLVQASSTLLGDVLGRKEDMPPQKKANSKAQASKTYDRFSLPGLTLPLNYLPDEDYRQWNAASEESVTLLPNGKDKPLFPSALAAAGETVSMNLTTLREFTMLSLMDNLTDKSQWYEKVFDETIAQKWKQEALATPGRDITEKMVDFVINELRYKAKRVKETGLVTVFDGDVVKSDTIVGSATKDALKEAVKVLEDIPAVYKDYHPGSDGKVLDLVHPSLFPLIYGRSRVLKTKLLGLDDCTQAIGEGEIIPVPPEEQTAFHDNWAAHSVPFSNKFQWLPAEVEISDSKPKITSYINNLHPQKHKNLYSIIENLIHAAIPMWNVSLTRARRGILRNDLQRIRYENPVYDPDPEDIPDEKGPPRLPDESEDDHYERLWEWKESQRKVVQPEPGDFEEPKPLEDWEKVDLRLDYGHRGLQVIVKLANIELTPEKPEYEGGTWHVEGQLNEHICATALYYYDSQNITSSRLAFRQQTNTDTIDIYYPQNEETWLDQTFGCENNGPGVQEVGATACIEGRMLVFPNILQHRVQPFKLADSTKPGHRKLVALFLVDPNIRVISTANVPPQQRDWWGEEVLNKGALSQLSTELKDHVFNSVDDFPIGIDEAKELRLVLMEERKRYIDESRKEFEDAEFSLCEH